MMKQEIDKNAKKQILIDLLEGKLIALGEATSSIPRNHKDIIEKTEQYSELRKAIGNDLPYESPENIRLFGNFLHVMNGFPFEREDYKYYLGDISW